MPDRVTVASERRLTDAPGADLRAAWSPDGASVVFERREGGRSRLLRVGAGGGLRALGEHGDQPWPLPGGGLVFHSDRGGTDAVWRLDADGGGAVRVTPGGGTEHVNVLGRYHFELDGPVARGELRPLRDPSVPADEW
ncbi:TolB family protein [Rubricoccus marinus]|uniref:TolB family protein n=1 Tax=Rubricoccus marinus TaxID=716817 RepID=UPI0015C6898B|nr:PD40 domain-containing protein [Rubricoccus marinus]